jgi:hypothetical protein
MEKVIKKVGNSIVIPLNKSDREFYNMDIGDRIVFTITQVIRANDIISVEEDETSKVLLD